MIFMLIIHCCLAWQRKCANTWAKQHTIGRHQQAATTKHCQASNFMARDYTSSAQRSPTRQDDATIRLDRLGEDDTLLLGEHSYDNFLDGLDDDVSFAVPKFSDRFEMRENRPTALPRPKVAETLPLRALPTHYGSRPHALSFSRALAELLIGTVRLWNCELDISVSIEFCFRT